MKASLQILAVDDHQLFLQGLAECLRTLPEVGKVVTCNQVADLNKLLGSWMPDIIFLDLNLREHDGFSLCHDIRTRYKDVFIAILTQYDVKKFMDKAKNSGANAYFLKNTDAEVLASFIQQFADGKVDEFMVYTPQLNRSAGQIFQNDFFELTRVLSRRELEVMHLLIKGRGLAEIQKELGITYGTLKSHRTSILQKLNVKNVAELVLLSMQSGPKSLIAG
jgi:two-component system, NarL family, response regulator NreC